MSNYNAQLQSNNTDLQQVLQTLQNKAAGGTQATPVISVSSNGLITATAGTKTSTHQLAFQAAKTITPSTTSQVAVSSGYYTGGNITVKGDANLVAGNIKSGVSIFGVSGTLVEGGSSSGEQVEWSANEDAIINRTLSNYFNDRVTSIGSYAFYSHRTLKTVSFTACTTIGEGAFERCVLNTVSFPICTTIDSRAFMSCIQLKIASFPKVTTIGWEAFSYCRQLTTANFSATTEIGQSAFRACIELNTISFPAAAYIRDNAFYACVSLTTINFPVATTIGGSAFNGCTKLTTASFPEVLRVYENAFSGCQNLTSINCAKVKAIYRGVFGGCYKLSEFYLTGSSVCTLSNSNAFSKTPYAGYSASFSGTPYIYVPASLLASYKTATNWTYFSQYFSAIEGSGGDERQDMIIFTIDEIEYQAEEGMAWGEWVESNYNICEAQVVSSGGNMYIVIEHSNRVVDGESGEFIVPTDKIIKNYSYQTI